MGDRKRKDQKVNFYQIGDYLEDERVWLIIMLLEKVSHVFSVFNPVHISKNGIILPIYLP
ncbi:hypothetical protein C6H68_11645 [Photorhabdus luminescens]|uniref:Uncharacterized protein n=1 Tax=Photorhabdus laumondii subsp. clarkei TaxID=2029685 RepID=A0A329VE79_9GAMM|nr:hypothetical protein C6H68_11645 [Photorhabdus luminescens]RAW85613.1 hypothetical protein CKY01_19065 [Photorhabdus laumondii subsp. clarkei]